MLKQDEEPRLLTCFEKDITDEKDTADAKKRLKTKISCLLWMKLLLAWTDTQLFFLIGNETKQEILNAQPSYNLRVSSPL